MLGGIDNSLFLSGFGGFLALAALIPLMKWAFPSQKKFMVVPVKVGKKNEYGLLKPLPTPRNYVEAQIALQKLEDKNIKATLAQTLEGPALMVFEKDINIALAALHSNNS